MNKTGCLLIMLCLFQLASATGLFYSGGISIEALGATILIEENEENATIFVEYLLVNEGEQEETVSLGFADIEADDEIFALQPGESKAGNITYTKNITGGTFSFDPTLLFDGKPNAKRVGSLFVELQLAPGIQKIMWANQDYSITGPTENGGTYYVWAYEGIYPAVLEVKWSTLKLDLIVVKEVSPQKITSPNQTLTIQITIQNEGDKAVNNIVLIDEYLPSEFEAPDDSDEFFLGESTGSEPRLFWIKTIGQLQPKETQSVTYSIRYVGDVSRIYDFGLQPCLVIVNGTLAGVSNEVTVSKMVGATLVEEGEPEAPVLEEAVPEEEVEEAPPEEEFPPEYIFIGIIVLLILAFLIFKPKKQ